MAVYPTTLARNPSEPDRAAAVRRVRSEVTPWYPGRRYSDRWVQGRRQYFDRLHWRAEKDTIPASLTEKNVRTWLPPVARLKV